MIRIAVGATMSKLLADDDTVRFVSALLTIENPIAQFTKAKRFGYWDGTRKFLRRPANTFPTGLVPRVIAALRAEGVPVQSEPTLTIPTIGAPLRGHLRSPRDPSATLTLHAHQQRMVDTWRRYRRLSAEIKTGGGKTECAIECMRLLNVPTLFCVHRQDQLDEMRTRIGAELDVCVGCIGGGLTTDIQPITVASIPTLKNWLGDHVRPQFWNFWQFLIFDEAHHTSSKTWLDVGYACTNAFWRLALSGTLSTGNNVRDMELEGVVGPLVSFTAPRELEDAGLLADTDVDVLQIDPSSYPSYDVIRDAVCPGWRSMQPIARRTAYLRKRAPQIYAEMYTQGIVRNDVRNRAFVAAALAAAHQGHKVLLLVTRQEHGKRLHVLLDGNALWVYGDDNRAARRRAIEHLEGSGGRIVIASDIWRESVNIPSIDVVGMVCGGQSRTGTLQRIGRGKRAKAGARMRVIDALDGCGGKKDYLRVHARKRIQDYHAECYPVRIISCL